MIEMLLVIAVFMYDNYISHTFPIITIITICGCSIVYIIRWYLEYKELTTFKKAKQEQIDFTYEQIKHILSNLSEEELNILRPFLNNQKSIRINNNNRAKVNQLIMKGLFSLLEYKDYPAMPEPYGVLFPSELFVDVLRKYFEEK